VKDLQADADLVAEMGLAKWTFMTRAEALVHGDLHTGSVMVRAEHGAAEGGVDSTRAFDSEFSFHGPVAFDLGALWGNYVLAASRAIALGEDDRAAWALGLIGQTWDAFEHRLRERWPERVDPRVFTDGVREGLLERWRSEAWLFGAAKAARRIVGMAKVSDVETLPEDVRVGAARGVLQVTRRWVRERHVDADPARAASLAGELLTEFRTN
jgi:5-methylthioribose kinase